VRTALGKMIDREKTYSTYKMYSQDVQMTMQWWFDNWTELMFPLEKEKEIEVFALIILELLRLPKLMKYSQNYKKIMHLNTYLLIYLENIIIQ
jgi:hypothetical protein